MSGHLEILRVMARRRFLVAERIDHAHAFDRLLGHAVEHGRRLDPGGFENGRVNIDDVMELRTDTAHVLDAGGPGDDQAVVRAAPP